MADTNHLLPNPCRVAVMGATGNVGRALLQMLVERKFPASDVHALASARSKGKKVGFGDSELKVQDLANFDFSQVDLVLASAGGETSLAHAPRAAAAGAIVVDNSSAFRMHEQVPLVVPEVNPEALALAPPIGIVANPNCSTIQMVAALKPIHDAFVIKRVVVSTYQSVSGGGKAAMDELFDQTKGVFTTQTVAPAKFTKPIAFNAIPHIDSFLDDGSTKEEWKMRVETNKILDPNIKVHANCVRIPVFVGHGEMVNVECAQAFDLDAVRDLLEDAPGVLVVDQPIDGGYMTPAEISGDNGVYISRIRRDDTVPHGLSMWIVSDNLRKGAALNTVQIAELMLGRDPFADYDSHD